MENVGKYGNFVILHAIWLWVVVRLYGFSSLFIVARPLKFQRLRLEDNFDIIVELQGLVA